MIIECGKGHLYDNAAYSACPYCNNAQQNLNPGRPVGADIKTMPPRDFYGGQSVLAAGKTLPPRGYHSTQEKRVEDEGKTVSFLEESLGIDPTVGWLVCVEGKEKGKDYRLKGRINTIGRSEKMDVCIKGDNTISSENHAQLGYSERNNQFTLLPTANKNYIYINDREVFSPTVLAPYDIIDFGATKLLFVPLCGEKFRWKNAGEADGVV